MHIYSRWNLVWSIGLLTILASPAYAGWGQAKLIGHGSYGALAVDHNGKSHIVFLRRIGGDMQLSYTTYNSRGSRGALQTLPISIPSNQSIVSGVPGLAIDSLNHPHLVLVTAGAGEGSLIYLSFDGSQWSSVPIPEPSGVNLGFFNGTSTPLVIDAQDHPHVAYASAANGLTYASYDGSVWNFQVVGIGLPPNAMRLGPDGTVYIATSGACIEIGSNGNWSPTCFGGSLYSTGLGLTADGYPEVAYIDTNQTAIQLARFDGTNWSITPIVSRSALGLNDLFGVAFQTDDAGVGKLIFSGSLKHDTAFFAQEANGAWSVTKLGGEAYVSFESGSMSLDAAGLPHIAYWLGTPIGNYEAYIAQTLAALTTQWTNVTTATKSGKTTVTGTLQVNNFGTAVGSGFTVNYYLSADDQLDSGDTQIGHSTLAIGTGQQKALKFTYAASGAVSGDYLIASISTANPQAEADTSNNLAVSQIP